MVVLPRVLLVTCWVNYDEVSGAYAPANVCKRRGLTDKIHRYWKFSKHRFINEWVEPIPLSSWSTPGKLGVAHLWEMNKYLLFAFLNYKRWEKDRTPHDCLMLIIVHFHPNSTFPMPALKGWLVLFLYLKIWSVEGIANEKHSINPHFNKMFNQLCSKVHIHIQIKMIGSLNAVENKAVVTDCIPLRTEWLLNAKLIWVFILVAPINQTGALVQSWM